MLVEFTNIWCSVFWYSVPISGVLYAGTVFQSWCSVCWFSVPISGALSAGSMYQYMVFCLLVQCTNCTNIGVLSAGTVFQSWCSVCWYSLQIYGVLSAGSVYRYMVFYLLVQCTNIWCSVCWFSVPISGFCQRFAPSSEGPLSWLTPEGAQHRVLENPVIRSMGGKEYEIYILRSKRIILKRKRWVTIQQKMIDSEQTTMVQGESKKLPSLLDWTSTATNKSITFSQM